MAKQTIKSKKHVTKSKPKSKPMLTKAVSSYKYTYLIALIFVAFLSYLGYKKLAQPADINAVYSGGAPSVRILGTHVYTKDGKWVPPGTYAGTPCPSGWPDSCQRGRNISGQFYTWGTYGKLDDPAEVAANSKAAREFSAAVMQAAGYTTVNPCGGDFYYYSTTSNTCKALKERKPSMYNPRMTCERVQRKCESILKDFMQGDSQGRNKSLFSQKYLEPIEANTQVCFTSASLCEQQN